MGKTMLLHKAGEAGPRAVINCPLHCWLEPGLGDEQSPPQPWCTDPPGTPWGEREGNAFLSFCSSAAAAAAAHMQVIFPRVLPKVQDKG